MAAIENLTPTTPKARRLSIVGLTGAALAVLWAGLEWAGVNAPEAFVSAVGTLGAMVAGAFEVRGPDGG